MDFPGGTVDENPPADAGDTGSIPGPGRFHKPHAPQLLSPCATTTEDCAPQEEKPLQWEAHAPQQRSPCHGFPESLCQAAKTHYNQINK